MLEAILVRLLKIHSHKRIVHMKKAKEKNCTNLEFDQWRIALTSFQRGGVSRNRNGKRTIRDLKNKLRCQLRLEYK